jgi:hypothetical protein
VYYVKNLYVCHTADLMIDIFHYTSTWAMANCIKTLGAYYGRPTWFEKVFPSSRPWSVRTVAPPKLTLGTDLKTKFVTMTVLTVAAFVYIIFMLIYVKIVRLL